MTQRPHGPEGELVRINVANSCTGAPLLTLPLVWALQQRRVGRVS